MNTARVRVDLQALAANYRQLRDLSAGACAGVVKANAYGLGLSQVVGALSSAGCSVFCVATLAEALELRELLHTQSGERSLPGVGLVRSNGPRIVLLGGLTSDEAATAAAGAGIEPVLNSLQQAQAWWPWRDHPAILHIDTGMERLGFQPGDLGVVDWSAYRLSMLMTHLACADTPDHELNELQLERFAAARAQLPAAVSGLPTSIANSAGCLLPARWHGDLSRPGIGLYGGHPQNRILDNPLRPVVHLQGQVVLRRSVDAGRSIGYGASRVATRNTEIAVVGLGYADGLPRVLSNTGEVSINGRRAPILGRVSMDVVQVDVTDLLREQPVCADVGAWVEFLGADIGVDEVAQWAGTIGLEVLCGLGRRPVWEYFNAP